MKFDPVYLVAAKPDTRVKLSRRAFWGVVAGAAAAGCAAGYCLRLGLDGVQRTSVASATGSSDVHAAEKGSSRLAAPTTPDPRLRRARQLARGSDADLGKHAPFFVATARRYRDDAIVRVGVTRLAGLVLADLYVDSAAAVNSGLLSLHESTPEGAEPVLTESIVRALRRQH